MKRWPSRGNRTTSNSRSGKRGSGKPKHHKVRQLFLEALETRMLLSTVTITATKPNASEQPQTNGLPDPGQATISLDAPASQDLTVTIQVGGTATFDYSSPASGDFTFSSNVSVSSYYDYSTYTYIIQATTTIPAGQTSVNVDILPVNDDQREPSETVTLTLIDGSGGGCCCCGCGGGSSTVGSP